MYAEHKNSSFSMAFAQRMIRDETNIRRALEIMSIMADFVQQGICLDCCIQPPKLEYFDTIEHSLPTDFLHFLDMYNLYKLENA